ncbi:MAG: ATP-binding protein [Chloroflexi bacterium]|nr:MAG: ATP-binding protein [Chloroflexota bacterium]
MQIDVQPLPPIKADGDRIVQVLNNLVGNAIKYTQPGGRVLVRTREAQNGVELIVSDNGPGIPEKDLPRIFERFYQVDKTRGPSRGTGLGLAITHEIVQMHNGKINVQSIEGHGTQFTVWLPMDTT